MGIYYKAMDHQSKEQIEPPYDFDIKSPGIFHPHNPFPNIVTMANVNGSNFEIVPDYTDLFYADGYKDMTDHYLAQYESYWPDYDVKSAEWKDEK